MRHAARAILLAAVVTLGLAAAPGRAEAICFADNITSVPNAYNMDWHSPDGSVNQTYPNAVYIQLHQICGWSPHGSLDVTMGWFGTGVTYYGSTTNWNYSTAQWHIHDTQMSGNWYRFSVGFVRTNLWHGGMERYDVATSSWVGNGTVDLWK